MTDLPRNNLTITRHRRFLVRGAFTLVEGLIATVVLAIGVVGIATMVSSAAAQASVVRQEAIALSLARELSELTAGVPFASGPQAGFTGGNADPASYDDIHDFTGFTDIFVVPGTGLSFVRAVDVTADAGAYSDVTDTRVVTISITPPRGRAVQLSRFVTTADTTREGT